MNRGFTLIELMITITIASLLLFSALPFATNTIQASKGRTVVSKFIQDFSWLRNQASNGTHASVTLTLNADCTWVATMDGVADNARSFTSAQLAQTINSITCSGGSALPTTFTYTPQGLVTPTNLLTFSIPSGQIWPVQVYTSGSIVITRGAS